MTWGVQIARGDGTRSTKSQNVCGECKHGGNALDGQPYRSGHLICNVQAAASSIADLLTAIDVGADGHMACGGLFLHCSGFEPKQPAESSPA